MSDHAAFVAAAGLDADTHDPSFREFGSQKPPTDWCVVELPAFGPAVDRDVELGLARIDSSRRCDNLCHLRRPCLVKRTELFRQPSGSDEGADDDHATGQQQNCSGWI